MEYKYNCEFCGREITKIVWPSQEKPRFCPRKQPGKKDAWRNCYSMYKKLSHVK